MLAGSRSRPRERRSPRCCGRSATRARFAVVLRGAFARRRSASRSPIEPLEDAVRRLVEGHSVVVLRDGSGPASGAAGLAEIRVIENPAPGGCVSQPLRSPKAADPQRSYSEPRRRDRTRPPIRLQRTEEEYPARRISVVPPPTREDDPAVGARTIPTTAARAAVIPEGRRAQPRAHAIDIISACRLI